MSQKEGKGVVGQGVNSSGNSYTKYSDGAYYYKNNDTGSSTYYHTSGGASFYKNPQQGYSFYETRSGERRYK